jgi:glycosyltransferase involved in cell wall biosynthesis
LKRIVSVIIPNYNHSKYLRQRVDSVLNQTYKDYELIILDDCSDDDSVKIIQEYVARKPDIITSFNTKNSGSSFSQWNYGVSLAKGKYVWIAESDDFAENTFLEKMTSVLQKCRNAGLVYCDSRIINEIKGITYYSSDLRKNCPEILNRFSGIKYFLDNPIINISSVLFRREVYLKIGGADKSMLYCGDWFFYVKMIYNSDIYHINEPLNIFRLHSGSTCYRLYTSNKIIKERLSIFYYILKRNRITLDLIMLMIGKTIKGLGVRAFFFFKFADLINIELPRIPDKKYIVSLEKSSLN